MHAIHLVQRRRLLNTVWNAGRKLEATRSHKCVNVEEMGSVEEMEKNFRKQIVKTHWQSHCVVLL